MQSFRSTTAVALDEVSPVLMTGPSHVAKCSVCSWRLQPAWRVSTLAPKWFVALDAHSHGLSQAPLPGIGPLCVLLPAPLPPGLPLSLLPLGGLGEDKAAGPLKRITAWPLKHALGLLGARRAGTRSTACGPAG